MLDFQYVKRKSLKCVNNALNAMDKFQPDMIFIACNTLSVIYPFTHYSQNPGSKVSGIVNHGVRLIHKNLMADPDSQVIIFGTPTTVAEKSHQKQLVKMGVNPDRIISQGCTDLAGKIERNPFSGSVPEMINANVKEAVLKMNEPKGKVYAAHCCTHFGYCQDIFYKTLSGHEKGEVIILNPNQRMADRVTEEAVMEDLGKTDAISPDIDMRVVSRVFWEPERIDAYIRLLKDISPETVKAWPAINGIRICLKFKVCFSHHTLKGFNENEKILLITSPAGDAQGWGISTSPKVSKKRLIIPAKVEGLPL